jgi:rhodanese-related sulfurtransferase
MRQFGNIVMKAVGIVIASSLLGIGVNFVSPNGIPWIYAPKTKIVVDDVEIPIVSGAKAREYLRDGNTIFLDTREAEEYVDGHIKGALSFPDPEKEDYYTRLEARLPRKARIVLYCSGPECHMAENVAVFLAKMGYTGLMVMSAGMEGWESAGYPVATGR